jgi:signal peptidase I
MKYTKLFFKFIQGGLVVVVICVVSLLILGHFGYVETVKPFVVQSGSMEPSVPTASIVFSLPQSAYQQGDIITFHPNGNVNQTVTHRIEFKLYPDGVNEAPLFITAGDANKDVDKWEVRQEHIIGKTVLTVPFLGYLVDFAKKPEGFILLVIVPATIVIYEELKALFMEIIKGGKKLKRRYFKGLTFKGGFRLKKDTSTDGRTISENKFSPPKTWMVIPLFGVIIFMISFSAGYFSDIEKSIGNIFKAGTWEEPSPTITPTPTDTPPQIAQTLVINEVLPVSSCSVGTKEGVWLEIYNGYPHQVNLKDYKITDGTNTPIALIHAGSLILENDQMALLAHDASIWQICSPDRNTSVSTGQMGTEAFNINSGHLRLLDLNDDVIDTVKWGPQFSDLDPDINQSIERDPKGKDTELGENFNEDDFEVREIPTPGN